MESAMNKITFSLIISGWTLQEALNLPDDAEELHVNVEYVRLVEQ